MSHSTNEPRHALWLVPAAMATVVGCLAAFGATSQDAMSMEEGEMVMGSDESDTRFSSDEIHFFEAKVRPLLISACSGCHSDNGSRIRGGFEIDTRAAMVRGGDSGAGVVPGDPDASILIQAIRYDDPFLQMPPRGALTRDEISVLEKWVTMGAPMPEPRGHAVEGVAPGTEFRWSEEDIRQGRLHWAYQPLDVDAAPVTTDDGWANGELDHHVLAGLQIRGVTPTTEAGPESWLRRVTFDLTGLPPTPDERTAFLADERADAKEHVVDRLLQSSAFGERWGRHWLDVARYAESSGKETNVAYPQAWRYRDWVVSAFNRDLPYDRFLTMQLAGDLLPANSEDEEAENLIATGYLAIGTKSHATRRRNQFLLDLVDEQIDATTQGLLATTVACARCHDHKFDPIPQADYYALAGIFASTETRFGSVAANQNRQSSALIELPAGADLPDGPSLPDELRTFVERRLKQSRTQVAEAERIRDEMRTSAGGRRSGNRNQLTAAQQRVISRARRAEGEIRKAETLLGRFDSEGRPTIENFNCMGVVEGDPRDVPFLERGELDGAGKEVPRGFPRLLDDREEVESFGNRSGRLELADWITRDDHPLTSRVWANRIWLHLFGRGIVTTPDNFGLSGRTPTNQALLDHLASRLVELDWSTKDLVREIVLSRTYGLSSRPGSGSEPVEIAELDVLTHGMMPHRRLQAEAIRDAMLSNAGLLDPLPPVGSAAGVLEGVIPAQIIDRLLGVGLPDYEDHRSIYLPIIRSAIPEQLAVFDFPEPEFVAGDRDETNVATQALYLMNGGRVQEIADALAARILESSPDQRERLALLFLLAYGREPSSYEFRACRDFLNEIDDAHAKDLRTSTAEETPRERRRRLAERRRSGNRNRQSPTRMDEATTERKAWSSLCQTIFQSSEFRTLD
ncbi:MAG: DUF1549 domain-containing protein [Phycisphaera sp.]|nr:DUF1549 domain-containing protein [Phycisphaera sp.]